MPSPDAVRARLQAILDAAERPAVAMDLSGGVVATNRAASDRGRAEATTFADLITLHALDLVDLCVDVDRDLGALDLDIPSRSRSVDGRERVRLVPFAQGIVVALSRFGTYMAELDPVILRSEIHDGLSQDLSALGFAACALRLRLDDLDDPVLGELATRVESLAEIASTTVRALYRHFERGAVGGLLDALATMGAEIEEATGTQVWIRVDGDPPTPPPAYREPLVAMVRAAVVALAAAGSRSRAWLRLAAAGERSHIAIRVASPVVLPRDARDDLDARAGQLAALWRHDGTTTTILL